MAYVFAVTAQGMMRGDLGFSIVADSGWGVLNALVSTAIALFMIPVLEMTCRVTTDLTLLELSDLNRPLLRRLMLEAPGTYHHSMVMGTMCEAGCEAVGANSLLGRVQCYYHDIGKISKPEYFIENIALNPRARNPHDRLTPSMSCLILESHVREGVALAREHKLPEPLIDAIREHHGTSEMSFFYEKAKALDPNVQREEFRYPGPRPRSKETAIVMLADGVEAASRVLTDPRPSRIRQLVNRIVESRVEQGELEECGLTLADLAKIREAFVIVLTGIFHGRVRYPTDTERAPQAAGDRDEVPPQADEAPVGREKNSGRATG
jgi:putative nucleotidyltransferase with HDIG domain